MKKVSVIVPVYNVEKYLNSCILSLVNQTIDNYEIIFVNDNSSDNSLNILKFYEKMYPYKIRVVDLEENKGVSYCRNLGLSLADGEFIYFMDSDDVVSLNFLNDFYNFCKDNDLLLASSSNFRISKNEMLGEDYLFLGKNDRMQRIVDIFKHPHNISIIGPGVWDKLIKHDMIPDNPFLVGKVFEDIAFCHPLVLKAHDVGLWYRDDYAYRYTPNSIMESHYFPKPSMIDIIDVCSYSLDFCKILGMSDEEISIINEVNKKYLLGKMYSISKWDINDSLREDILRKYGSVCSNFFGDIKSIDKDNYYTKLYKYFTPSLNPEYDLVKLKKKIKGVNN